MSKKILLPSIAGILICFAISRCTESKTDKISSSELITFPTVYNLPTAGTAFIDSLTAAHMRHYFDVWHRNRRYYDESGKPSATCPPRDATDDGDIRMDDTSTNDSLSKSVWFDKRVIAYMAQLLIDSNCDGIRIYYAAYNKMDAAHAPGQINQHQSTVFLVPTDSVANPTGKSSHVDNYRIVEQLLSQYQSTKGINGGAENHGELCPQDCP